MLLGRSLPITLLPLEQLNAVRFLVAMHACCQVMMEQATSTSRTTGQKDRFVAQVVTPQQPTYHYGAILKEGVAASDAVTERPILGVACSVSGHKVKAFRCVVTSGSVSLALRRLPKPCFEPSQYCPLNQNQGLHCVPHT